MIRRLGAAPGTGVVPAGAPFAHWWRNGLGRWIRLTVISDYGNTYLGNGTIDTDGNLHVEGSPESLQVSTSATTVEIKFAKADFGIDGSFGFSLESDQTENQELTSDEAPDGREEVSDQLYNYVLSTAAPARDQTVLLSPVIGKPVLLPARPTAGKRITISMPVTRGDNRKPLTTGKLTGEPSIAGKVIRHTQSFKSGVPRLSLIVPKTAQGKPLKVKVTIEAPSYEGEDGSYVDVATGKTGAVYTHYRGRSATKTVNVTIR